jgi:hypothetical protein
MRRLIQDWQIKGSFTQKYWTLEVKEKNAWSVEAESESTTELLKIANSLTD